MTGHLFIYGEIGTAPANNTGTKYYSLDDFRKELDPKATDYIVHISSVGGDVFEGFTMYNLLRNTGKPVEIQIEGVCASIATLIAGAGTRIRMNRTAKFMIHNPSVSGAQGDSKDLRNVADQLDKIKTILIDVYKKRTGLSEEKLWAMYDNETWMTADEAKSMGFVDEAEDTLRAVARIDSIFNDMKKTEKAESILQQIKSMLGIKPKNQMSETLEDGRVILIMAEGDDWSGAAVTLEDGSPLEPGEYMLAGDKKIVIGEGSTITEVMTEPNMEDKLKQAEDRATAAEARIKELESAIQQTGQTAAKAEAKLKKYENEMSVKIKNLEDELKRLETEPAGTPDLPNTGDPNKNLGKGQPQHDGMAKFFKDELNRRGF